MLFRDLTPDEAMDFRIWAQEHHAPGDPIDPLWHPVVRAECARLDDAFGRENYLNLADEMSADGAMLDAFDDRAVAAAEAYALRHGIPWPIDSVDLALDYVREAERGPGL